MNGKYYLFKQFNHLTTPQSHLVTLWRVPSQRLETTGPNYLTSLYKINS